MADTYRINKFTGELDNVGDETSTGITTKHDLFTLDATDISNKYVTLTQSITDNQSIRVFVDNAGIKAEQGVDYSISGSQIFWTGYTFDGVLIVGDKLKIFYV